MYQRVEDGMGQLLGIRDVTREVFQALRSERTCCGVEESLNGSSEAESSEFCSWTWAFGGVRGADGGRESVRKRTYEKRVKTSDHQT